MYVVNDVNYPSLEQIDNFGLTPVQFRVYLHLWRLAEDGVVSISSESISKSCNIARITVIRVLSQLCEMKLIECDRTPGKKSLFCLMPPIMWRKLAPREKVVQFKTNNTCNSEIPVSEINNVGVNEINTPPVNETNTSNPDTTSLDDKLAAARSRGWWDTGTWWDDCGRMRVTVNRFVVSVEEFLHRSLDSFDATRQVCESGLAMCRAQIEKIKRRSS